MGWFNRTPKEPKPDPIGDICRLLVDRPWEWESTTSKAGRNRANPRAALLHVSGVFLVWATSVDYANRHTVTVWLSVGSTGGNLMDRDDSHRLYRAIQGNAAARMAKPHPIYTFPAAAKALAKAVDDDDMVAAKALADMVSELASENVT